MYLAEITGELSKLKESIFLVYKMANRADIFNLGFEAQWLDLIIRRY